MTETTTRMDEVLDPDRIGAITELMLAGRRISEVIAHGLTRRPGWRRNHVVDLVAAKGWTLDSDGRIPRDRRTSVITPATRLPGAPAPEPARRPVVVWPEKGTVPEGPRVDTAAVVDRAIVGAKTHPVTRIRVLAQKAEDAITALYEALGAEQKHDEIRRRLAKVEAEAERLRAQLPGKTRKAKTGKAASRRGGNHPVTDATRAKPIKHGTWSGWLAEDKRGLDHCDPCNAAKDWQTAWMKATPEQRIELAATKPQPVETSDG